MSRFPVIERDAMSPQQRAVADEITAGPRGALKGPFLVLIHNPALAGPVQALGEHLRFGTNLARTLVEIGVLVAARRWNCQYEWFAHERIAREAGLRDEIIAAIAQATTPPDMTSDETLVYRFSVDCAWDGQPRDDMFNAAVARFGLDGTLDLIAICGYYTMLAMVLNAAQPALPDGVVPLAPLNGARP